IATSGSYYSTGQRCTASSRLIVTEDIHDQFVTLMKQRIDALTVGDARDPNTIIGPVVSAEQLASNLEYVEIARAEGGQVYGGQRLTNTTDGYYMQPALITETTNDMRINQEEVFGPVASVIKVKNYDDAVAVANDTQYGLSAGICTTSLRTATDFKRRAQAGMVMVNAPTAGVDPH